MTVQMDPSSYVSKKYSALAGLIWKLYVLDIISVDLFVRSTSRLVQLDTRINEEEEGEHSDR
jgi:hypothetical protein